MKRICSILLAAGAVPLLVYPFILLANVMSLGGHRSGHESTGLIVVVYSFLFASTFYPVVYGLSLWFAASCVKKDKMASAVKASAVPLVYLSVIVVLLILWDQY